MYNAEELVEETLDLIVLSCASNLYDKYIDNKTYKYASLTALNHLRSEVALSYVHIDQGETDPSLWQPPVLPKPCPIDSWAKCVIPLRSASSTGRTVTHAASSGAGGVSRASAAPAGAAAAVGTAATTKVGLIERIEEAVVLDAAEQQLREAKERTFKKRNDEELAEKRRHDEEEKEVAKISKIREELKHKQFSHDADGNVIFLEPVDIAKLPSSTAVPVPKLKTDDAPNAPLSLAAVPSLPPAELALAAARRPVVVPDGVETADGFKRLAVNLAISNINPRPGVTVTEKGRSTKGPDAKKLVHDPNILSKAEYLQMVYLNRAKQQESRN